MVIARFTQVNAIYSIPQRLSVVGNLSFALPSKVSPSRWTGKRTCSAPRTSSIPILIIGIGGQYAFGGNIPFFGIEVPTIAGAAIFGILLNLILSIGQKKQS